MEYVGTDEQDSLRGLRRFVFNMTIVLSALVLCVLVGKAVWTLALTKATEFAPAQAPSGSLSIESEAGRRTVYLDKATGVRVLCATGSACVVLPASPQPSH